MSYSISCLCDAGIDNVFINYGVNTGTCYTGEALNISSIPDANSATFTATSTQGYEFDYWYYSRNGATYTSTDNPLKISGGYDISIIAYAKISENPTWKRSSLSQITVTESYKVTRSITISNYTLTCYRLVFNSAGTATFKISNSVDYIGDSIQVKAYLGLSDSFDETTGIPSNKKNRSGSNFSFTYTVEANTYYYVWVRGYDGTTIGETTLDISLSDTGGTVDPDPDPDPDIETNPDTGCSIKFYDWGTLSEGSPSYSGNFNITKQVMHRISVSFKSKSTITIYKSYIQNHPYCNIYFSDHGNYNDYCFPNPYPDFEDELSPDETKQQIVCEVEPNTIYYIWLVPNLSYNDTSATVSINIDVTISYSGSSVEYLGKIDMNYGAFFKITLSNQFIEEYYQYIWVLCYEDDVNVGTQYIYVGDSNFNSHTVNADGTYSYNWNYMYDWKFNATYRFDFWACAANGYDYSIGNENYTDNIKIPLPTLSVSTDVDSNQVTLQMTTTVLDPQYYIDNFSYFTTFIEIYINEYCKTNTWSTATESNGVYTYIVYFYEVSYTDNIPFVVGETYNFIIIDGRMGINIGSATMIYDGVGPSETENVALWDWEIGQNTDKSIAYNALTKVSGYYVKDFKYTVWNELLQKIYNVYFVRDGTVDVAWFRLAKMYNTEIGRTMTAQRFNYARGAIGGLLGFNSTENSIKDHYNDTGRWNMESGEILKGAYILDLAKQLNTYIDEN